jgi:hypothetical protein
MFYHMFFGVFCDICIYRFTHSTGEHACIPSLPCQKTLFDELCVFFLSSGLEAASDPWGFGHDKAIVKVPLISSMLRRSCFGIGFRWRKPAFASVSPRRFVQVFIVLCMLLCTTRFFTPEGTTDVLTGHIRESSPT